MTTATHDIDTATAAPLPPITDLKGLSDVVYDMATTALIIKGAESTLQAKLEAAKKAFDEATAHLNELQASRLATVVAYCEAHKDELFPVKNGKRKKSFAVLQHQLQYRSSDAVEAPAESVSIIKLMIVSLQAQLDAASDEEQSKRLSHMIDLLTPLIRQPDPELNKDAVKGLKDEEVKSFLKKQGIEVKTSETFKVTFSFSPTAQAQAA